MDQYFPPAAKFSLYSQRAILVATFFGGPMAAGILARQNFINLGDEKRGNQAFYIGIIATVLVFGLLFSLPQEWIEKIPRLAIPTVYMGIIYFLIQKFQGNELEHHKENQAPFYSLWKAFGIGLLCLLAMFVALFLYAFFFMPE